MEDKDIDKVSIKFRAGAYGAYRSMNNKVWYALAEYVDNALQSYIANQVQLRESEVENYQFTVYLNIKRSEDYIEILDNAAGIDRVNFVRAFEPANIPLDISGLSEFGMGMKIASIWLADSYTVESSALGEPVLRKVSFDLRKVIEDEKEELVVHRSEFDTNEHYTKVTLNKLSENAPHTRQIIRLKKHLTSIYRKFLASGEMKLVFNGEDLVYEKPRILEAPDVDDIDGPSRLWVKEIDFEYQEFKVSGFIGILNEMKHDHNGISLFRRGRVIQGSHDEKYHPKVICGFAGSPRYKRIFGELDLEGFKVSFDKGRFTQVDELENVLLMVKKELTSGDFNLLKQAERYRKQSQVDRRKLIKRAVENAKRNSNNLAIKLNKGAKDIGSTPESGNIPANEDSKLERIVKSINWKSREYTIEIEFINQKGLALCDLSKRDDSDGEFYARINLGHNYFTLNANEKESLGAVITLLQALLFAEAISISQGTKNGGYIRSNLSKLLDN